MRKKWLADAAASGAVTKGRVPFRKPLGPMLFWVISFSVWPCSTLRAQTAAELIEQAKQYDAGYTAGPEASQRKALDFYQQALHTDPDSPQRLQILFRMAQLHSCAYLVEKGETPNYLQAISCYERILATYSSQEPLVVQSMMSLADCFVNLRRFDEALYWSKKTLAVNTQTLEDKIKAWEKPARLDGDRNPPGENQPPENPILLQRTLRQLQLSQCAAVEQIATAALRLDPLWAQAELQALEEQYPGTCIARRAREILDRQANAISDMLAPSRHIPLGSGGPMVQSAAPPAPLPSGSGTLELSPSPAMTPPPADGNAVHRGQTEDPPLPSLPSHAPRAPPLAYLGRIVTGAAGLMVIAGAAWLTRKLFTKGIKP